MSENTLSALSEALKNSAAASAHSLVAVRGAYANISGVVIATDTIVTVAHVLDRNDTTVKIVTFDGRELEANIKGRDPRTDVALLQATNLNLPVIKIATQPSELAELVLLVVRDAQGFLRATHGIISSLVGAATGPNFAEMFKAMRRGAEKFRAEKSEGEDSEKQDFGRHGFGRHGFGKHGFGKHGFAHPRFMMFGHGFGAQHFRGKHFGQPNMQNQESLNMLHTDAKPFPGASGGVLQNARGEMIGLVNAGLMRGQALALPVATLRVSVEAIQSGRAGKRGFLGVTTHSVPLVGVHQERANQAHGLLVASVAADSAAAKAGLMVGDILVRLNGQNVEHPEVLLGVLNSLVGETSELIILRGGQIVQLSVTITEAQKR